VGEWNDAVDLSNKMFVRMWFVKSGATRLGESIAASGHSPWSKKRYFTDGKEDEPEQEANILKPCVYKLR